MAVLDDSTKIPLRAAIPVIFTVVAATVWISSRLAAIHSSQDISAARSEYLKESVEELKDDFEELKQSVKEDRWSHTDMEQWIQRARQMNPSLVLPEAQ